MHRTKARSEWSCFSKIIQSKLRNLPIKSLPVNTPFGCILVYRYTKEGNINELRHNSMYGYENNRNSLVYRYTRTAPSIYSFTTSSCGREMSFNTTTAPIFFSSFPSLWLKYPPPPVTRIFLPWNIPTFIFKFPS